MHQGCELCTKVVNYAPIAESKVLGNEIANSANCEAVFERGNAAEGAMMG